MEITILDYNLEGVCLIEHAKVLWNEKYYDVGDFELYFTDYDQEILNLIKAEYYVMRDDTNELGIIEDILVEDNIEDGCNVKITGRFITCILERRIILETVNLSGKIEDVCYQLIQDNIINPENVRRKIPNFELAEKKNFPDTVTKQVTGKDLLTIIKDICTGYGYGFKVVYTNDKFVFEIYKGRDCTYNQEENTWMLFSEDYENLISSMLEVNVETSKTFALVAGEGEGSARKRITIDRGAVGMDRKEMYVDARDLQSESKIEGGKNLTEAEYLEVLTNRGIEKLEAVATSIRFQGDVDATSLEYRKDYFLGDRVIVENNVWGLNMFPQVTEVLESYDDDGYTVSPTFETGDD